MPNSVLSSTVVTPSKMKRRRDVEEETPPRKRAKEITSLSTDKVKKSKPFFTSNAALVAAFEWGVRPTLFTGSHQRFARGYRPTQINVSGAPNQMLVVDVIGSHAGYWYTDPDTGKHYLFNGNDERSDPFPADGFEKLTGTKRFPIIRPFQNRKTALNEEFKMVRGGVEESRGWCSLIARLCKELIEAGGVEYCINQFGLVNDQDVESLSDEEKALNAKRTMRDVYRVFTNYRNNTAGFNINS